MKYLAISITYLSFFGLLGFSCYWSGTLTPLWGLILGPAIINSILKYENYDDE